VLTEQLGREALAGQRCPLPILKRNNFEVVVAVGSVNGMDIYVHLTALV
jgi:hypothetical protein